jgi:hypothetical protein
MKRVVRVLVGVATLVVIFYASLFAFAEVFTEIVVLRTYDSDGLAYETRVTVIDIANTPWVRGRSYRGWFRRIEANPTAELYRGDVWRSVRASVSRDPADAAEFERLMLERYGLMYRYFDFIARMSSNEIPVRLAPRVPQQPVA